MQIRHSWFNQKSKIMFIVQRFPLSQEGRNSFLVKRKQHKYNRPRMAGRWLSQYSHDWFPINYYSLSNFHPHSLRESNHAPSDIILAAQGLFRFFESSLINWINTHFYCFLNWCLVLEAGRFFTWIYSPKEIHINGVALYHLSYPKIFGDGTWTRNLWWSLFYPPELPRFARERDSNPRI